MLKPIASVLRDAAAKIDLTPIGESLLSVVSEYHTKNKELRDPNLKESLTLEIFNKGMKIAKEALNHGLSQQAYDKFMKEATKIKEELNPVKLLSFYSNFALAWKARAFND